jgi:cell wall-associated NlpC family hydrolase
MRKFTTLAIAMAITVAGCSASTSRALSDDVMTKAVPAPILNKKTPFKLELTPSAIVAMSKKVRNHARMAHIVKYLSTRVNRTPYVFSGSSIYGWDCSGMVRWVYNQFGLDIPHSANKQAHLGTRVSNPNVGDIVVFAYNGSTDFYHSAIYIGNGKVINANLGSGTTIIEPISNFRYSQVRFVRLIEQAKQLWQ